MDATKPITTKQRLDTLCDDTKHWVNSSEEKYKVLSPPI
jgi:hypothetical protein